VILLVGIWRNEQTSMTVRLEHTLVTAAFAAFVAFAWYWRVMLPG
jgi:hypothetical protein